MPSYDATLFIPPAPVARVLVYSPSTGTSVGDVPALIDTGADVSLLPLDPIRSLIDPNAAQQQYELEAFDGTRSVAPSFRFEVRFLGKVFRGQFLVVRQDYAILGRNILNALPLYLDGPKLTWGELR